MQFVDNVMLADAIFERKFVCQLDKCHGQCCVSGDAGAPLEEEEIEIIQKELEQIKPFMDAEGLKLLEEKGFWEIDEEGDKSTSCRTGGECVFVFYNQSNYATCAIEEAWNHQKLNFRKPMSCHLYPIRAKKYGEFIALNYHDWDICAPACKAGNELNVPVYEFLKDALIRKFGKSWYEQLILSVQDSK